MARTRVVLVVGSLALGAVWFLAPAAAGGGCHPSSTEITAARGHGRVDVPVVDCAFAPTILYVAPGTEVTWFNKDPVPHTVTDAFLLWGSPDVMGRKVSHRFDEEGIYPYYCDLHPGMAGAVVVGDPAAGKAAAEPIELLSAEAGSVAKDAGPGGSTDGGGLSLLATAGIASMALVAGVGAERLLRR